ncbi:glycosyltransferase [Aequorivita sp. KMM 9714]|uniref:glycosyltransferase n=1 Tax=Aequorivita sp. KMM 9714 TaxID=2707173 RepID=UPI0013ECB6E3|nr:glycosyltransferase [Aequorivita sp. KMM 9714]NGX85167.1 glycosyltransferase family 4 protein [Aequorivita sp. KMM 9714]
MDTNLNTKKLLIIGHTYPEPSTTAAGGRMMQLINFFTESNYEITFVSTASKGDKSANLLAQNISIKNIKLNDSAFDDFVKELNPTVVIFDRFITEEQFGWRVSENCPNALKILDTEDLHFLRNARKEAIKKNRPVSEANLFSDSAKRELASILRCDLSLIISEYEIELLRNTFKISSDLLFYLPLLADANSEFKNTVSFTERENFLAIGNLLHPPNVDSVLQLKKLWPKVKRQIPSAELHVYGAYAPQQILQLNNKKEGFIVKGWAEDVKEIMNNYRLQLAPIRFGAGLKGKLFDAMQFGLPSITTEIGAEGLYGNLAFGGIITTSDENFVTKAIELYSDENAWQNAQENGFRIIENRFLGEMFSEKLNAIITSLVENITNHRQENFLGQVIQHHTLQSTKYLSKWIETKNQIPQNSSPVCFANSDEVRDEYK